MSERPDELLQIAKRGAEPERAARAVALPLTVELPSRYYVRDALLEVARAFAELAEVRVAPGDGVLTLTVLSTAPDAGPPAEVIDELLNHALYASATAPPEATR